MRYFSTTIWATDLLPLGTWATATYEGYNKMPFSVSTTLSRTLAETTTQPRTRIRDALAQIILIFGFPRPKSPCATGIQVRTFFVVFLHILHCIWSIGLEVIYFATQDARIHVPYTPTEGLRQIFCDPQLSMTARRIFNLCS